MTDVSDLIRKCKIPEENFESIGLLFGTRGAIPFTVSYFFIKHELNMKCPTDISMQMIQDL